VRWTSLRKPDCRQTQRATWLLNKEGHTFAGCTELQQFASTARRFLWRRRPVGNIKLRMANLLICCGA
jgi:hypothetical protein